MLVVRPIWPDGHGEKLLLAAIIRRAAYDIALYRGDKRLKFRKIWNDAHGWMFRNNTSNAADRFTSFVSICTLLDQDPNEIRRKTLRLTRKDVRKYDMVGPHAGV